MLSESIDIARQVVEALEKLGVRYALGGSLAAAVHGVMRATMDADIVAALQPKHAALLVETLGDAFYADPIAIEQAIRNGASFNLLHLGTMFKVDVFVAKDSPLDNAQLEHRQLHQFGAPVPTPVYIISAEDIVLVKLEWYRLGDQVSDRQWQDIIGVLQVQAGQLDIDYLTQMAGEIGLEDLLHRALEESR